MKLTVADFLSLTTVISSTCSMRSNHFRSSEESNRVEQSAESLVSSRNFVSPRHENNSR